jgi:hypothetical protein
MMYNGGNDKDDDTSWMTQEYHGNTPRITLK